MRWGLVFAALVAASLAVPDAARCETPGEISTIILPKPGVPPQSGGLKPKLFGGISANNAEFGTVVAILYAKDDGKTYICSGAVVGPTLVLTAGHCGCGVRGTYWISTQEDTRGISTDMMLPVVGAPILFDQRVCRDGILASGNDLALLRLGGQGVREFGPSFKLVQHAFDLRNILHKGDRLLAVGYGYTESHLIGMRRQAHITIYSFTCEERALGEICAPFTEMVLAEAAGARVRNDTCGGDSGGPVFRIEPSGQRHLVGITSRAAPGTQDDPALGCGGGGIYTLIGRASVQDWLVDNNVVPSADLP